MINKVCIFCCITSVCIGQTVHRIVLSVVLHFWGLKSSVYLVWLVRSMCVLVNTPDSYERVHSVRIGDVRHTNQARTCFLSPEIENSQNAFYADGRAWASIAFLLLLLGVGVPLWWRTTEVPRIPLPYSEMEIAGEMTIQFHTKVLIFAEKTDNIATNIKAVLESSGLFRTEFFFDLPPDQKSIEELEKLDDAYEGHIRIVEMSPNFMPNNEKVYFGEKRTVYFTSGSEKEMLNMLYKYYLGLPTLMKILGIVAGSQTQGEVFQIPLSGTYDILFTLGLPQPHSDLVSPEDWNFGRAQKRHFAPTLETIAPMASFRMRSQILPLGYSENNKGQLASALGAHPRIHFVAQIVPCREGVLTNFSADTTPKWGGYQILPLPCSVNDTASVPSVDSFMEVALAQFRLVIGITDFQETGLGVAPLRTLALRGWERDHLIRWRAAQCLRSVGSSLNSLSELLGKIGGMVVNDVVGGNVHEALAHSYEAKSFLENGRLSEGMVQAKKALVASEKAFHHPSMLALLYFPEDQKYAVYIPLFLPVGIPMGLSLLSLRKWFVTKRSLLATKKNQ